MKKLKTGFGYAYERRYAVEIQQSAKQQRDARARRKYEQHRQETVAVNRGLDRQIRTRRSVAPQLPFYPAVHQVITRWPPYPIGSLAYVMAAAPRGSAA